MTRMIKWMVAGRRFLDMGVPVEAGSGVGEVIAVGNDLNHPQLGLTPFAGELTTVNAAGTLYISDNIQIANSILSGTVTNVGTMTVGTDMELALLGDAMFTMNSGSVTVSNTFQLAAAGEGTFNMNAGTVPVGTLDMAGAGKGHINLDGGTIVATVVAGNASNTIAITEGVLIESGDQVTKWNEASGLGLISAYGGGGQHLTDFGHQLADRYQRRGRQGFYKVTD